MVSSFLLPPLEDSRHIVSTPVAGNLLRSGSTMRLGTLRDGTRDGALVVVDASATRCAPARSVAPTLQAALDDWGRAAPALRGLAAALEAGDLPGEPFEPRRLAAPLPRAYEWLDGSAYLNHVRLVRAARKAELPPGFESDPLVYQ